MKYCSYCGCAIHTTEFKHGYLMHIEGSQRILPFDSLECMDNYAVDQGLNYQDWYYYAF